MNEIESLRLGVAVNLLLVVFGFALSLLHQFAASDRYLYALRMRNETREQFRNIGFPIYLAAGSAFFGCALFTKGVVLSHLAFLLAWPLTTFFIIFCELGISKVSNRDSDGWTFTRIVTIPAGVFYCIWVYLGA